MNERKSFNYGKPATIRSKSQNFPPPRGLASNGYNLSALNALTDRLPSGRDHRCDNTQDLAKTIWIILQGTKHSGSRAKHEHTGLGSQVFWGIEDGVVLDTNTDTIAALGIRHALKLH